MFDVIRRSVNTNLNKPLDTLITEKSTETNGKIDSKASQTSVTSMDTKVGVTSDAAGTASAGTLFGKMNKLLTDWTTARAAKIDTIATDVTSLKTSVVNGKQAVVNAINGSLGYASGLTTNHPFSDYAWWIQNMIKTTAEKEKALYNTITSANTVVNMPYTVLPYTSGGGSSWSRALEPGLYFQIHTSWRGSSGYPIYMTGPSTSVYLDSDNRSSTITDLPVVYKTLSDKAPNAYILILVTSTTTLTCRDPNDTRIYEGEKVWYKLNI